MEQHFNLSDQEFEAQFANATLDPALFTHEAHLRLAWIHISKYGESMAVHNITEQLVRYVQSLGAIEKYNKTLTIAAIKAVSHFMGKQEINSFNTFIMTYPRLNYNFKDIIGQHYGFDIFNSTAAKKVYLEPDLLAFT